MIPITPVVPGADLPVALFVGEGYIDLPAYRVADESGAVVTRPAGG